MTIIINTEPAADYIKTHGWTQGTMEHAGAVCLTGALRACSPQPGDWLLARAVYRAHLIHAETWNDDADRTEAEVTGYLRTHPVTDDDLAETFGPNWETVVRLIRRVTAMPQARDAALDAAWDAARDAAWVAALDAAWDAARDASWDAAWVAARDASWDAARDAAWDAALDAASAVVVRDLITKDHYQTLTAPIRAAIGSDWDTDTTIEETK